MQLSTARTFDAPDIVSGRQRRRAELARRDHQIGELHALVATDAGYGRLAARIALRKVDDDSLPEARFIVEHVVRDAEAFGDAARIVDILPGAAGTLFLRRSGRIELQGDADH